MRRACAEMQLSRAVYLYRSVERNNTALLMRMKEITQTRVHYGYRRVHVMLKREGFKDNHKRIYRLYREQGLPLRHKRPKRNKAAQQRQPKTVAQQINQIWSMYFVAGLLEFTLVRDLTDRRDPLKKKSAQLSIRHLVRMALG